MDPDAAWELMLAAYQESNWDEAAEHAEAMLAWLRGGGFAPKVTVGLNQNCLLFSRYSDEELRVGKEDGFHRFRYASERGTSHSKRARSSPKKRRQIRRYK